jgi:hypothetical protein
MPNNNLHLIYSENNIYKIIYFIRSSDFNVLLYSSKSKDGIQIYEINNNNLLFPQLNSDFDVYSDLCSDYGVNKFNILFINKYKTDNPDDKTEYKDTSYNVNLKTMNVINFNKKEFFKKELNTNKLLLNKSLILKENDHNIINFIRDEKNRVIVKLKEKEYPIEKILFKLNKCIINDTKIEKYKSMFQHILDKINSSFIDNVAFLNDSSFNELLTCE